MAFTGVTNAPDPSPSHSMQVFNMQLMTTAGSNQWPIL